MRPVAVRAVDGLSCITQSAWEPSDQELQLIIAGASIVVTAATAKESAIVSVEVEAATDPPTQEATAERRCALTLATIDALINNHTLIETAQMLGRLVGRVSTISAERNWSTEFNALFTASAQSKVLEVVEQKLRDAASQPGDNKEPS